MTEQHHMTLGELIDALEKCPRDALCQFDFLYHVPGALCSYRGYYERLCIQPNGDRGRTVGCVLDQLRAAVYTDFEGWKGGTFHMHKSTLLHVDDEGHASETIVTGIQDCSQRGPGGKVYGTVYITTEHDHDDAW